jgi:RimJ/RimL family protein N-acetyltransferase
MNHKGTRTIETERLILRKFTKGDIRLAYKNWTSDKAVTKYLRWPTHKDLSVTERVLNDWIIKPHSRLKMRFLQLSNLSLRINIMQRENVQLFVSKVLT